MGFLSVVGIVAGLGLKAIDAFCNNSSAKRIQEQRQAYEREAAQRNHQAALDKLKAIAEAKRNIAENKHQSQMKVLKAMHEERLHLITDTDALKTWPLLVYPFVINDTKFFSWQDDGKIDDYELKLMPLNIFVLPCSDRKFQKRIWARSCDLISSYISHCWSPGGQNPILYNQDAFDPNNDDINKVDALVDNIRTMIKDVPTIIIAPRFRVSDGGFEIDVYHWKVDGNIESSVKQVQTVRITEALFKQDTDYTKAEAKYLSEKMASTLLGMLGNLADIYFWFTYHHAPQLPKVINDNTELITQEEKSDIYNIYYELLIKSLNYCFVDPILDLPILLDYCAAVDLAFGGRKCFSLVAAKLAINQKMSTPRLVGAFNDWRDERAIKFEEQEDGTWVARAHLVQDQGFKVRDEQGDWYGGDTHENGGQYTLWDKWQGVNLAKGGIGSNLTVDKTGEYTLVLQNRNLLVQGFGESGANVEADNGIEYNLRHMPKPYDYPEAIYEQLHKFCKKYQNEYGLSDELLMITRECYLKAIIYEEAMRKIKIMPENVPWTLNGCVQFLRHSYNPASPNMWYILCFRVAKYLSNNQYKLHKNNISASSLGEEMLKEEIHKNIQNSLMTTVDVLIREYMSNCISHVVKSSYEHMCNLMAEKKENNDDGDIIDTINQQIVKNFLSIYNRNVDNPYIDSCIYSRYCYIAMNEIWVECKLTQKDIIHTSISSSQEKELETASLDYINRFWETIENYVSLKLFNIERRYSHISWNDDIHYELSGSDRV